ncbi:MAG TPA: hypothetical protein VGQ86_11840 [Candidatus Limnocylindria bacterium]|nr:hypothetical protein [Candidatus Limnocylindria bacterium]
MRRLLLAAAVVAFACQGAATLPAPSQRATPAAAPTTPIDVSDMMGAFPASTFFVVTDDGVKAIALLNHATRFTLKTSGQVQLASFGGSVYVADETADGTRLRWIQADTGTELASWTERGRRLVATGIGHGALVVEPTTQRVLALYYSGGDRFTVEAYEPYSLRPLGKRLEAPCGDRLLAAADRVVVMCDLRGTILIKDGAGESKTVDAGLGTLVAGAISLDGTTLVGRDDGTLARIALPTTSVEKIEPFRPGKLVVDGIASPDAQTFVIALQTSDLSIGVSEVRSTRRYISFPAKNIPTTGLLALGQFAFWVDGSQARHVDLYQGFAETMATLGGRALAGAVSAGSY